MKKNKFGLIFIGIVFLIVLPIYINAKMKFADIEEKGNLGIGKFVEYERKPKTRNYYFEYYKNEKKIRDLVVNLPLGFQDRLGSFFEIKYLENYNDIIVNYNKEVTDTTAILKAGFSREDIMNVK
uniref:hypothetical protein n=1 Tax=Flavobacterium sp. TaxID=239 RepID=UPI00404A1FB7